MIDLLYPRSLSLLLLLLPLFFITVLAQYNNANYPNCPSYNCGDLSISYPFWNIDSAPTAQFCGYQGFGIKCSNNNGSDDITLGGDSYHIRRINYNLRNIVVSLLPSFVPDPNSCNWPPHGINLETSLPLSLSKNANVNLSVHLSCYNGCPSFASEVPCSFIKGKSCVHVVNSSTEKSDWKKYSCIQELVTPVLRESINRFTNLSTEFGRLMDGGFMLEWRRTYDCDKCEESGGRCGHHNANGFICFCYDSTTSSGDCKDSLKHKTEEDKNIEAFVVQYGSLSTKRYKYRDLKKMTDSFKVKLGEGGFGHLFKGKLSDGRLVAVKILNSSKANGQEFINEVASIGRTSHVNIVTLLGFCFNHKKRALVYEYMPNGSLEKFIHSHVPMESSENIGVKKMYEIAHGIACGLDYLHRGCNTRILHLDIKPHNILLNEDFCPKIADFGLAKLYSRKESIVSMFEARGTIGYIAPEVYNTNFGGVSHKSDVYSYGMLLLEMVGGRNNIDVGLSSRQTSVYFPDWIYKRLHKDDFLLDSVMTSEENDYARKMTIIGLWCIQPTPNQRPSIDEVIKMLEGSMEALEVPPKPIFSSPPRSPVAIYSTSQSILEIHNSENI